MQPSHLDVDQLKGLLDPVYCKQAEQNLNSFSKKITLLLSQRKIPEVGWSEDEIRTFLREIALLDANNAIGNVGVGEREGRVWSRIVNERHFGFTHGSRYFSQMQQCEGIISPSAKCAVSMAFMMNLYGSSTSIKNAPICRLSSNHHP